MQYAVDSSQTSACGCTDIRRCSRCGASYSSMEWASLHLSERIDGSEVRRALLDWPESVCIEVRRCRGCGRDIAAKTALGG
jgi:hypothetical protein